MSTPRIPPVTDPTDEVVELYVKGGMRAPDGNTLNIFATLAHHPALVGEVQTGTGFVQQHQPGLLGECSRDQCKLTLPARQPVAGLLGQRLQPRPAKRRRHRLMVGV